MKKYDDILKKAEGLKQKMVDLRRDFHQYPELGLQEFSTARKVEGVLRALGLETRMFVNGTGVRGFLKGSGPGKTIALRADMDALPIQEETDLPYQSQNKRVMHACGHDAHMAMLLGAATILSERKKELKGNVAFIFQPAEETGAGAKAMVDEGALEGTNRIFGLHVYSILPFGTLGYRSGPLMAAGDFFDVKITGKGGHGGLPHLTVDPVVIAANAISTLQTIVSREADPVESAVISICKMDAGETYNVIPETATFGGTIRSHKPELREALPRRIKEILDGLVSGMRGSYEFNLMSKFPATINDEEVTAFVAKMAKEILGEDKLSLMKPLMGSEDFSYYLQKVPGTLVFLGVENKEKGILYPQHHPKYNIDEDILPIGTALHCAVALEYLKER
ncbi:MAG: amidohydrolase [Deltaproteobacteria bacterium]|nr:amidohydrolase [Deltaproteobacteria bacterium]